MTVQVEPPALVTNPAKLSTALEPCSLFTCAGLGVFNTRAPARTVQLEQEPPGRRPLGPAAQPCPGARHHNLPPALAGWRGFSWGGKEQKTKKKQEKRKGKEKAKTKQKKKKSKKIHRFCFVREPEWDFTRCRLSAVPVSAGFCGSVLAMHKLFPFIFSPLFYF